jgi:hypothetical protein
MTAAEMPAAYRALIDSNRVSTGTRDALLARAEPDDPAYRPTAMTGAQLDVLRAVVRRVVPQPDGRGIDLAARLDAQLAEAQGDGWRFAALPEDRAAYARALDVLDHCARAEHGCGFAALAGDVQDAFLTRVAAGSLDGGLPGSLDGKQMRLWFEDLRADAVKLYVAHPVTLAALGYSGVGNGGDGDDKIGFQRIGLDECEAWEPLQP